MAQRAVLDRCRSAASAGGRAPGEILDLRFRALLPVEAWRTLPPAVRRRFTKRLGPGQSAVFTGHVVDTRMTRAGWLLAQACRLVGSPLPTQRGGGRAAVVSVTEDADGDGQTWTRLYARGSGFPQMIHSAKRFQGATGLEEHVGVGLGMSLTVTVEAGALAFRSGRYFLDGPWGRWHLPRRLCPDLVVLHADAGGGAFRFVLALDHPWLGTLLHQEALFRDARVVRPSPAAGPARAAQETAAPTAGR